MKQPFVNVSLLLLVVGLCSACSPAFYSEKSLQVKTFALGITGQVTDEQGGPTRGAYVYAYRNMRSNLRGPADFEAQVDETGHYLLDLVEGDYYLVARMRQSGAEAGPPKPGDAWALPAKNPVRVTSAGMTTADFILQSVVQPMLMRTGTLTSGDTGFTGMLLDGEGHPLAGAFVIAYPDTEYHHMPEATSPTVGEDGRFRFYVERIGQWCLAARTRTRGQPVAGEPYGLLGDESSGCRTSVSGQVIDVGAIHLTPYRQ